MLFFRWLILLLLLASGLSFALYVATSQERFRQFGWQILKWTLLAAFGFFAVLIMERVA
jgi:hypothetical protein